MAGEFQEIICILCPVGCWIRVHFDLEGQILNIQDAQCKDGKEFARNELILPQRMLTTTVSIEGGGVLPVKTNRPVSRDKLLSCMNILASLSVKPPISFHEVIVTNIMGTGSDIIATDSSCF